MGPVEKPAAIAPTVLEGRQQPDPEGLDQEVAPEEVLVAVEAVPLLVERRLAAQLPDRRAQAAVLREAPEVRENPVAIRQVRFNRSNSTRRDFSNSLSPVDYPRNS